MIRPRIWPVIVVALAGIAVLIGLGLWQLQRLSWKQALIAEIESRAAAAPVSLKAALALPDAEFVRVETRGVLQNGAERFLMNSYDGSAGYTVITPLISEEGVLVLLDRGLIPAELKDPGKRPGPATEPATIAGQLRRHGAERGVFVPDNDEAGNVWFWWDVPALLASIEVPPNLAISPYVLHVTPGSAGSKAWPRPQALTINLRNNHFAYALTWFGLALALAAVAGVFVRQRLRVAETSGLIP